MNNLVHLAHVISNLSTASGKFIRVNQAGNNFELRTVDELISLINAAASAIQVKEINGMSVTDFIASVSFNNKAVLSSITIDNINNWNNKQNALGYNPENLANKGIASGYASLDPTGRIPIDQIPLSLINSQFTEAPVDGKQYVRQNGDWVEVVIAEGHIHPNITSLNKLSVIGPGQIVVDGKLVQEVAIENGFNVLITEEHILSKQIELPHDCESGRPITLTLQGLSQVQNIDWVVIENTDPIKDLISWDGHNMENVIMVGDVVIVSYYKKHI